jgi:opacity protein-like surface antigen
MIKNLKPILLSSVVMFAASNAFAGQAESNASDRYFYVGADIGIAEPVVKSFKYQTSTIRLKQSRMYGGRVGYSFYPNMMIELSGSHHPTYRLAYILPESPVTSLPIPGVSIPKTHDKTKVKGNIYMVNLIYEAERNIAGIRPFATIGAGLARLTIQKNITNWSPDNIYVKAALGSSVPYFQVNKTTQNCLAWQVGAGLVKDLNDMVKINFTTKLQVVNNIKIKYDTLNAKTGKLEGQKPIKKSIGVGEFSVGFAFKLPIY